MSENLVGNSNESLEGGNSLVNQVDEITRARAGSLSAHGLSDQAIADILLLTVEQVNACHQTEEFRKKYAEEADLAIQAQVERDEGWDAIESEALGQILQTLKHNRDPKYALFAAKTANQAERGKKQSKNGPIVIDNTKQTTNIITLNLNRNFIKKSTEGDSGMIDVTPRPAAIPLKQSDIPSPKLVEELLAPVLAKEKIQLSELEQAFKESGVVFDE